MCFSAQASFIAGAGLSLFGIYTLQSATKRTVYLRAIPLMFGIQQLFEGVVWVTQGRPEYAQYNMIGCYGFLFFAFFAWPIWTPFALQRIETDEKRKRMIFGLMMAGAVVSTLLAWGVIMLGVHPTITCNHIEYIGQWPTIFEIPLTAWYCLATLAPFFIMKKRMFHIIGLLGVLSVVITIMAYYQWFTSVWCFFAAILSISAHRVK